MRLLLAGLMLVPVVGAAQGTIGGQGFGYPAGELSGRAAATGGALAPFDPMSPVNPATTTAWKSNVIFFHVEPESRTTSLGGTRSSTNVSRFPLLGGGARISSHASIAITFSTYLDRTWQTVTNSIEHIGADSAPLATRYASNGAINDLRLAFGWTFSEKAHVGVGVHAYTGENRLNIAWDFPDTVPYGDVSEKSTLSYEGSAVSLGAEWRIVKHIELAAYGRAGGAARVTIGDTLISKANMPNHLGAGIKYDGVAGTVFSAAWEHIDWTRMRNLGSATLDVRDGDRISVGAETRGPSIAHVPVYIRLGASQRTLPFGALGSAVKENTFSAGVGYLLAKGLANLDIGMQHQRRSAGAARENAWVWTFGLAISPTFPISP